MTTSLVTLAGLALALVPSVFDTAGAQAPARPPNIVFILADDLGYGDIGPNGQKRIETPSLDRMAREGMRFTQFYAGSPVCAPSRSVLMTGQHTGHTRVRGNGGAQLQQLRQGDFTVAELLKAHGYQNGLVGKWGLGEVGMEGNPLRQGFDYHFGYLNQTHAHNYYPESLWRNNQKVPLRNEVRLSSRHDASIGAGVATKRVDYSHDLLAADALEFIDRNRDRPFFLYLAMTLPHANNEAEDKDANPPEYRGMEVPDFGPYATRDWPATAKGLAAMITRMDRDVGRVLDRLHALGIAENTLVIFSSDNGPHREGGNDPDFFDSNGPLRGIKRDLYEGGIRVPTLAWWPGKVAPGSVSDHIGYFGDFMATAAELIGVPTPPSATDGISILPTLLGRSAQQKAHPYLYWEFYERGSMQAVRMGRWKGVRFPMLTGEIELYDLATDIGEERNIAAQHPEIVQRIRRAMEESHRPAPEWQPRGTR